jgi:hypothetical protein
MVCNTNNGSNHTYNEINRSATLSIADQSEASCASPRAQCYGMSQEMLVFYPGFWWLHSDTNIVKEELQVQVHLILDDHIVKNHTSGYDVIEGFFVPKPSGTSNYCKSGLQNPERPLDVFSGCFLCLCQFNFNLSYPVASWSLQMFPNPGICCQQNSSQLCSHGHWWCSCMPEHHH